MRTFINVEDIGDLRQALAEAEEIKKDRYKYQELGKNKTLLMIFFNNSLRTRLSTQKAATNLGMSWKPSAESSWTGTRASTCLRPFP